MNAPVTAAKRTEPTSRPYVRGERASPGAAVTAKAEKPTMPEATKAPPAILRLIDRTFQSVAFVLSTSGVTGEDLAVSPLIVFQRKSSTSAMRAPKIVP